MPKSPANPKVDAFISRSKQWKAEYEKLRAIVLGCGLVEDLKWGVPCYTVNGKNVVLIHGFKDYCAILFVKGALLKDPKKILITQTANVQSARQVRFRSPQEVTRLQAALKAYIKEAVDVEASGRTVDFKATAAFSMPAELTARLEADAKLRKAFEALTPGRQRAYILHVSAAKQAATRVSRIEKCVPRILDGKGLDD
jgi:uncharacterized protein YdeI (YjbR/CyaY-like superfamily)